MADKTIAVPVKFSPGLRVIVIWLCCAGVVGGLGCATMIATSSPNQRAHDFYNKPVLTDSVFALARPDAALAKKIGCEGAIAFLGKKRTFLLVEGGAQLSRVAGELDGDKLTVDSAPRQLFIKGKTVWGNVTLNYSPGQNTAPGESDRNKLQALGFKADNSGVYRLAVPVKGVVYPAAKLGKEVPNDFRKSRDIAFYNPPDSSPPPDLGKLITVPLAVVVDVALTPVYLVGFVVLVLAYN